ncbi:chromosome segregation protein [Algoriella xinjiangensis]|uniref:AAA family ATPase n=1 Tax=Algoriella xinjiangensis TaxID=684065 RepID=UPI000F632FA2|nr:ATP-binding protein [Algoriella xinjiangensis]VDH16141.1 chromosome segregation protein [Algoriella xinjiangensis]
MKNIVLKTLELKNFKSFRHAKFDDFNEKENFIYGKNGAGKSTLFDAFLWLLFGKDANDRKDYEIKPLDENNQVQKQIDVEVHATLLINNEEVTLSRIYKEKWQKVKGAEEKTFKGHETELIFNQVPVSLKEFNSKVADISEESLFKLITNPSAFESLDWKKKREVLVSIAGEISDEELFNSDADFKELSLKLTNKTLDEYDTQLKASIKKSKQEKEDTPARIDELKNSKIEAIDFDKIDSDVQEKETKVSDIDSELENASVSIQKIVDANTKVHQEIQKLNSQKSEIEIGLRTKAKQECFVDTSSVDALRSKLRLKESERDDYTNNRSNINSAILDYQKQIEILQTKKQNLVDSYNNENAKQLIFDEKDFNCPCCSRPFEEKDIDSKKQELILKFNTDKTSLLNSIINDGNKVKKQLEIVNNTLNSYQTKLDEQKGFIDQLTDEVVSIENQIQTETSNLQSPKNEEEVYQSLINNDAQLSKLKIEIATLQSGIKEIKQADNSELKEQKQIIQSEIKKLIELKGKKSVNENIDNRIKELASREKELSQIIASLEKEQFVIERFKKVKTESLEKSVNEKFEYVTFKLFEEQVNGGLNPTCITLVNGVPFGSANTAGRINAGLDIINTLCKVNEISAPVFLDNRESVTKLIPTESQIISLIVDPNQETLKFN